MNLKNKNNYKMKYPTKKITQLACISELIKHEYMGEYDEISEENMYQDEVNELDSFYHEFHSVSENLETLEEKIFKFWKTFRQKNGDFKTEHEYFQEWYSFAKNGLKKPIHFINQLCCDIQYLNNNQSSGRDNELIVLFEELNCIACDFESLIGYIKQYSDEFKIEWRHHIKKYKKDKPIINQKIKNSTIESQII